MRASACRWRRQIPGAGSRLRGPAECPRGARSRTGGIHERAAPAGAAPPPVVGPVFDSSVLMVEAALQAAGVALAPPSMFSRHLASGALHGYPMALGLILISAVVPYLSARRSGWL